MGPLPQQPSSPRYSIRFFLVAHQKKSNRVLLFVLEYVLKDFFRELFVPQM
jgi:hypothetical protein